MKKIFWGERTCKTNVQQRLWFLRSHFDLNMNTTQSQFFYNFLVFIYILSITNLKFDPKSSMVCFFFNCLIFEVLIFFQIFHIMLNFYGLVTMLIFLSLTSIISQNTNVARRSCLWVVPLGKSYLDFFGPIKL